MGFWTKFLIFKRQNGIPFYRECKWSSVAYFLKKLACIVTSRFDKVEVVGNNFTFKEKPVGMVGIKKFKSFIVKNTQNLGVFNRISTFPCVKLKSERNLWVFTQENFSLIFRKTFIKFGNRKTQISILLKEMLISCWEQLNFDAFHNETFEFLNPEHAHRFFLESKVVSNNFYFVKSWCHNTC